jgi:hypothetical protein
MLENSLSTDNSSKKPIDFSPGVITPLSDRQAGEHVIISHIPCMGEICAK